MSKSKRVVRIAACVLAGVMAVQLAGCGSKKVDYTLDGDGTSGGYSETEDGAALQSHLVYLTNAMRHLTWENQDFQR